MDLAALDAIDVHVHVEQDSHGCYALDQELLDASAKYFRADQDRTPTLAAIAEYYRARRTAAVVFTVDAPAGTGHPPISSEEIADQAAEHADVLIPFASVDPHAGKAAVSRARRLVTGHGARGFKFHPSLQAFEPNDPSYYPLYEALQELRVPALFHTGQTGIGAGQPGGRGIKLRYSAPMLLDDVAADFPDMPIVLAHPSFPWQEEALSVAMHKAQVYIDLSGWAPKLFPPILVQYVNGPLRHKALFGSDYPVLTPERWLAEFAELPIRDEVRPLVLRQNAIKLLGLS